MTYVINQKIIFSYDYKFALY